ncbi:MAG: FecR domain-containing protein, partial [Betaproteobacteria bacterium]
MAQLFGTAPKKLPPGQSIYRVSGRALVNGREATLQTPIKAGDTVETAPNAEMIFVVAEDAFILRGGSRVTIETPPPNSAFKTAMRLVTGKLLSVFGKGRPIRIVTATSTIGIRGTGVYAETDPEQTYFCTCYGVADIAATNDPQSR